MGNGIAIANNTNSPKLVKQHRVITLLFKSGLTITVDTNLIETDSLKVAFKLANGKSFSYKPNNMIFHRLSNNWEILKTRASDVMQ